MVQVEISDGLLEGELVDNDYGGKIYSFKGIPYAEPPVGELRFKAPQPIKPWDGVREAKEYGPVSLQRNPRDPSATMGSEDCLYLNVYSPDIAPASPLPVMVWIHGGGYETGSGDDSLYGPEFLVKHDVIVVGINYRLGLLGFLCLDTENIPGNAGLKDQVLALRWVKKNIASFGGDTDNITVFGESAGGVSVGFHLVSPMSKGLFNRAICQSGCAAMSVAVAFEPREKALKFARQSGLVSEDDAELEEFFKGLPAEKFINFSLPAHLAKKKYELDIGAVDEKDFGEERFFYGDIYDLLRNGIHEGVDLITGYTEDEGLWVFCRMKPDEMYKMANEYSEFFVPRNLAYNLPIKDQLAIGREVRKHYITNGPNAEDNCEGMMRYLGMEIFKHAILTVARFAAIKNKVYFYKFCCKTERNVAGTLFGVANLVTDRIPVCHGDDLPYLFQPKLLPFKVEADSDTFKLIDNITKMWTNFAKYGNPTPDDSMGVEWLPYDIEEQNYLDIGNQISASTAPDKEDIELWDRLIKQYLPHHAV